MTSTLPLPEALAHTCISMLGVVLLALAIGVGLGTLAGRRAGVIDAALHRLIELSGALPLFVAIPLLSQLWSTPVVTVLVLGYTHGLRLACLCRNETLRVGAEHFVVACRALGLSGSRTHWRHVFPFVAPSLTVGAVLAAPAVVSVEAAMAYLGLDTTPSCGAYLVLQAGPAGVAVFVGLLASTLALHGAAERLIARIIEESR